MIADLICFEKEKLMTYEVQTYTVCDGWINTWHVDDEPQFFDTVEEAKTELEDFLDDVAEAVAAGTMEE